MIELELPVHPTVLEAVRHVVEQVAPTLERNLPEPDAIDPDDGSLAEAWLDDLRANQSRETETLLQFLKNTRLGRSAVSVKDADAEILARASADLRLRIRADWLAEVADEDLENGRLELEQLPPREKNGALAYLVLAALQEALIAGLDPGAEDD